MYKITFMLLLTFSFILAIEPDDTTVIWKKYLQDTKEPALSDLSNTISYRLILHSAMGGTEVYVRITKKDDLYFTYVGWSDWSKGLRYFEYRFPLSLKTWNRLTKYITNDSFYNLPNNDNYVGYDGAFTILEGIKNGKYHYVERWEHNDNIKERQLIEFNELFDELYYKYSLKIKRWFLFVKEGKERI